jgi:hypothetical protein
LEFIFEELVVVFDEFVVVLEFSPEKLFVVDEVVLEFWFVELVAVLEF